MTGNNELIPASLHIYIHFLYTLQNICWAQKLRKNYPFIIFFSSSHCNGDTIRIGLPYAEFFLIIFRTSSYTLFIVKVFSILWMIMGRGMSYAVNCLYGKLPPRGRVMLRHSIPQIMDTKQDTGLACFPLCDSDLYSNRDWCLDARVALCPGHATRNKGQPLPFQ